MKKIRSLALASLLLPAAAPLAATFTEDFAHDPLQNGWQTFGNTNLFQWDAAAQNLVVTWDSTNQNSYFYHPLGVTLTRADAFSVAFDLQLRDAAAFGYGFELAAGLFGLADATNANFSRGGGASPNVCEFDYFPDTGFGDSEAATLFDAVGDYAHCYFAYDNLTLEPGVTYHIIIRHAAGAAEITGQMFTNGVLFTAMPYNYATTITDFHLDTLAVSSYFDGGWGDSILAHGVVDNFVVTLPSQPVQNFSGAWQNGQWQTSFLSQTGWHYTLERSLNLTDWAAAASAVSGDGTEKTITDSAPPANQCFYRLRADPQ